MANAPTGSQLKKLVGATAVCAEGLRHLKLRRGYLTIIEESYTIRGKEVKVRSMRLYRYKEDYDQTPQTCIWKQRLDDMGGLQAFRGLNPPRMKPELSLMFETWTGMKKAQMRWEFEEAADRRKFESKFDEVLRETRQVTSNMDGYSRPLRY